MMLASSPCNRRRWRNRTTPWSAPVYIEELIMEQLCVSNGGLQQGQEVCTMLHHTQKTAAGSTIPSSPQQHGMLCLGWRLFQAL